MFFSFKSDSFHPLRKNFPFTFVDFLSNAGGFMGLLAGISTLSVVEIFYHLVEIKLQSRKNKVLSELEANETRTRIDQDHVLVQLIKYFGQFIKSSDLHGAHYTMNPKLNRKGRIFWMVLLLSSVMVCTHLVGDMMQNAEKSPVAIKIETRLVDEVSQKHKKK